MNNIKTASIRGVAYQDTDVITLLYTKIRSASYCIRKYSHSIQVLRPMGAMCIYYVYNEHCARN